jgi:hypothetical protein
MRQQEQTAMMEENEARLPCWLWHEEPMKRKPERGEELKR